MTDHWSVLQDESCSEDILTVGGGGEGDEICWSESTGSGEGLEQQRGMKGACNGELWYSQGGGDVKSDFGEVLRRGVKSWRTKWADESWMRKTVLTMWLIWSLREWMESKCKRENWQTGSCQHRRRSFACACWGIYNQWWRLQSHDSWIWEKWFSSSFLYPWPWGSWWWWWSMWLARKLEYFC